jgi:membrane protease YdiL (CAAX protease family)
MAIYLWVYWRYLRGDGPPAATSAARRESLRANPVSAELWGGALFAGLLGLGALLALLNVLGRLVPMPSESKPIQPPPGMPAPTVAGLIVMAAIVAGVVEEAAFRGYLQGPIERRHGLAPALLVTGAVFGLAHASHHPAAVVTMLPYYVAVAAAYGGLAWATDSILPGIVLHAGGDVFSLARLWTTGRPEWQTAPAPPGLVWETGVDAAFVGSSLAFLALGAAAAWAYAALARAARAKRGAGPRTPADPG